MKGPLVRVGAECFHTAPRLHHATLCTMALRLRLGVRARTPLPPAKCFRRAHMVLLPHDESDSGPGQSWSRMALKMRQMVLRGLLVDCRLRPTTYTSLGKRSTPWRVDAAWPLSG